MNTILNHTILKPLAMIFLEIVNKKSSRSFYYILRIKIKLIY